MVRKSDLRVQRTYKMLTDTLVRLLAEKRFEDITVGELCERAMIRRATFYKHFGDKYELFTFLIKELQQQFDIDNAVKSDPQRPQTYYVGMIDLTLSFLEQNKAMVTSVVNSSASHILLDILSSQIEYDVRGKFREDEKRGALLSGKPEILSVLYTGALVSIAKWWILQGWKISKDEIVQECAEVFRLI
jgi:AcrR family transcriptional regulator